MIFYNRQICRFALLDFTISTFYNPRLVEAPRKQHTFIRQVWYELIFKCHTNFIDALDVSSLPTIYIHAEVEIRQQWRASAPPCQRYLCVPLPTSAPARPTAMVSTPRPQHWHRFHLPTFQMNNQICGVWCQVRCDTWWIRGTSPNTRLHFAVNLKFTFNKLRIWRVIHD